MTEPALIALVALAFMGWGLLMLFAGIRVGRMEGAGPRPQGVRVTPTPRGVLLAVHGVVLSLTPEEAREIAEGLEGALDA